MGQDEEIPEGAEAELPSEEIEAKRGKLLGYVASQTFDTMERRVAWVLNNFTETRDSDVALAIRYWEVFQGDIFNGSSLPAKSLYDLTRFSSLSRVRAKIQNTYRLYQASPIVRKRRGKLSEEEKAKAIEDSISYPVLSVYADESGKTDTYVVVGSLWIFDGLESYRIAQLIAEFKDRHGISGEFHFKDIGARDVEKAKELIDLVINNGSALGFKIISMNRNGAGHIQSILKKLYYFLFKRGVEHEIESGRTPLPRSLQIWKDLENADADRLLLAEIKEQLATASVSDFDNKLHLDEFQAVDSKSVGLLQIADLIAACASRAFNYPTDNPTSPKDVVAHYVLDRLGIPKAPDSEEYISDMAIRLRI
jgi:hypothetical protein